LGRPRGRNELYCFANAPPATPPGIGFADLKHRESSRASALALLVARVVTNDHDPAVPADNAALVADLLHARLDLHRLAFSLLVAVDDASPGQVVRREFDDDSVLGQDADVVLTHFSAYVGQDPVTVRKLNPEHCVREWLYYAALDLDGPILFRHVLRYLTSGG
jgi:hypothetical protein